MPEEARLDVLLLERLAQQRVVEQIDLTDGQIIGRAPIGIDLAEFLRLYEHYRARMAFDRRQAGDTTAFTLTPDNRWTTKYFTAGSPQSKARQAMAGTA